MPEITESPVPPRRIFVFDHPRTVSQMFNKLFADHGELESIFHPFMGASMYGPERMQLILQHSSAAEDAQKEMASNAHLDSETYQVAAQRLTESIVAAEKNGKIAFIKDHGFCLLKQEIYGDKTRNPYYEMPASTSSGKVGSPTWIPDDLYKSLSPLILIRRPARMIPSFYRTQTDVFKLHVTDEEFAMFASLRWLRLIFDSYRKIYSENDDLVPNHSGCSTIDSMNEVPTWPLLVDAEDVVHSTQAVALKLCDIWDIDPSGVQYSWKATPKDEWPKDKILSGFFDTLLKSTGVLRANKRDDQPLDIDEEAMKWTTEFGDEVAAALRRSVMAAMPDYEYLKQFRLRL